MPRSEFLSWNAEDRAYALAWEEFSSTICTCGEPYAVSTHRDNQYGYEAEVIRCHACAAQQRHMQKFQDEGGDTAGAMVRFTRKPE